MSCKIDLEFEGSDVKVPCEFSEKIEILQGGTFLLCDEAGTEVVAVVVGEETLFTATENDIRLGAVAATDKGVTTGEKFIPSYVVTEAKFCLSLCKE